MSLVHADRRRSVLFRFLAVLGAFAFLAAACGNDDGGESTDDTTTTEADEETTTTAGDDDPPEDDDEDTPDDAPLTASDRGVTADTINIGVSMLDFPGLVGAGLSQQGWGDQQAVWEALIADLNDRGGINGRMVSATYKFYSPIGTAEAEAACLQLTADIETFAVLGGFLGPAEPANTCVAGQQDTILIGGRQSPERLDEASSPWLESGAMRARRLDIMLPLLDAEGMLDGKNVALVAGVQAEGEFNAAGAVLDNYGIEPVFEALLTAPSGDIPAGDAEWANLSQQIETRNVDVVLVLSQVTQAIRGVSQNGLDVEIYTVDSDELNNPGTSITPAEADGVISIDGLTDDEAWADASMQDCIDVVRAALPEVPDKLPSEYEPGEEQWFNSITAYCTWLRLFELVATEAGNELTRASFGEAAASEFGQFSLPAIEFASLGPDKPDASDAFRLVEFSAEASENGELVPVTDIQDVTG